jgi:hypothetical protein
MMTSRLAVPILCLFAAASACGGGSNSGPTTPTSMPFTATFSGETRQNGNGCSGDSHTFDAAAGSIVVRLLATSDPANALSVQVCAGNDTAGNCAITQQKIAVGQSISGTRASAAQQVLKFLGHSCVFGGPPATAPITYRAEVTYQLTTP